VSITSIVLRGTRGRGATIDAGTDEKGVSSLVTLSFFVIVFSLGLCPFFVGATSSSSSSSSRDFYCVTDLRWSLASSFSGPSRVGAKVLGHSTN